MITRVEIEDELAKKLEAAAKCRGVSVRDFISQALKDAILNTPSCVRPALYRIKPHDFGAHIENPWNVLAEWESQDYIRNHCKK